VKAWWIVVVDGEEDPLLGGEMVDDALFGLAPLHPGERAWQPHERNSSDDGQAPMHDVSKNDDAPRPYPQVYTILLTIAEIT
jgi:hypothetical protein